MKTITYHSDGISFPDAEAEKAARYFLLHSPETEITVSTSNFVDATRCLVKEEIYPFQDVVLSFEDKVLKIDKNGRLATWPRGFCDYTERWLERLCRR